MFDTENQMRYSVFCTVIDGYALVPKIVYDTLKALCVPTSDAIWIVTERTFIDYGVRSAFVIQYNKHFVYYYRYCCLLFVYCYFKLHLIDNNR